MTFSSFYPKPYSPYVFTHESLKASNKIKFTKTDFDFRKFVEIISVIVFVFCVAARPGTGWFRVDHLRTGVFDMRFYLFVHGTFL